LFCTSENEKMHTENPYAPISRKEGKISINHTHPCGMVRTEILLDLEATLLLVNYIILILVCQYVFQFFSKFFSIPLIFG